MTYMNDMQQYDDLPDPFRQPEFYEGVALKRGIAWVIDTVLILMIALIAVPFTFFAAIFFLLPFIAVVGFAYRTITLALGSATFGMRMVSIEIRKTDGQKLDLGSAALHTLGYTISFSVILLQVVSIVLMFGSARGQSLTDHVLGTTALNRRR